MLIHSSIPQLINTQPSIPPFTLHIPTVIPIQLRITIFNIFLISGGRGFDYGRQPYLINFLLAERYIVFFSVFEEKCAMLSY
jgi:hypothetical protein